eukprot:TRINITY_DN525_c0_g2_i1.p1 TRINITY_DN525_c0_g2~~TRINITY_DN525_c0_g2_i1.p1  ORF type:complete len:1229 (-),score=251.97 TRINITY_DN525_c0_g2_i1:134-3820(-)
MGDPSNATPSSAHSRDRSSVHLPDEPTSTFNALPMRRIQSLHELANQAKPQSQPQPQIQPQPQSQPQPQPQPHMSSSAQSYSPVHPSVSGASSQQYATPPLLAASPSTTHLQTSFSSSTNLSYAMPYSVSHSQLAGGVGVPDDRIRHHSLNEEEPQEGNLSRNASLQDLRTNSYNALDGITLRTEPDLQNHSPATEERAKKAEKQSWTAMVAELPPLWQLIAQRVFAKVVIEPERLRKLYAAQNEGTLVHIAQTQSWLSYLVLNYLFVKHKLRRTHLAPGLTFIPWLPWRLQLRSFWGRFRKIIGFSGPQASDLVRDLVAGDRSVLLFLRLPQTWFTRAREFVLWLVQVVFTVLVTGRMPDASLFRYDAADYLLQLIQLQRSHGQARPIFVCPQNLIWDRTPTSESESYIRRMLDFVFGEKESPGLLREFYLLFRDWHRVRLRGGNPIDLRTFLQEQEELCPPGVKLDDVELARCLQDVLQNRLERETRTVRGPKNKPYTYLRESLLRSSHLQRVVHQMANEEHQKSLKKDSSSSTDESARAVQDQGQLQQTVDRTWRRCLGIVDEMAATPSIFLVRILALALRRVFSQIYRGIDYNEDGIEKIRQAALKGPVVLVPSHKSHLDYLLISYIFFKEDFSLPMIAAGNNLNIPILGFIFRRCGAYFIRRSFANDKLYTAVFREYVTHLLQEGFPVEFFIEGGRSRSGKVLPPKLGLLSVVVDAVLDGRLSDVSVVPISIMYDKIIETKSYSSELLGAEKKKESVMGLLSARKYLSYNFGRVGVKFADPISIREYMELQQTGKDAALTSDPIGNPEHRRHFIRSLGYRITYDINRVSVAMPTSLVVSILLTMRTRGISRVELIERVDWLKSLIQTRGGQVAAFEDTPTIVDRTLDCLGQDLVKIPRKLQLLDTVVRPRNKSRLELAYYRNQILHIFNNEGIIACALSSLTKNRRYRPADESSSSSVPAVPLGRLLQEVRFFSHLMKYELTFKPNASSLEDTFSQTVHLMVKEESLVCIPRAQDPTSQLQTIHESEIEVDREGSNPVSVFDRESPLFARASGVLDESMLVASGNPIHFDFLCALFWPFIDSYWAASLGLFGLLHGGMMEESQFAKRLLSISETLYQEGHIEYGDSVSSETLKNAVTLFIDMGVLSKVEGQPEQPATIAPPPISDPSSSSSSASTSAPKAKPASQDRKIWSYKLQAQYDSEDQLREFSDKIGKFRNLPKHISF